MSKKKELRLTDEQHKTLYENLRKAYNRNPNSFSGKSISIPTNLVKELAHLQLKQAEAMDACATIDNPAGLYPVKPDDSEEIKQKRRDYEKKRNACAEEARKAEQAWFGEICAKATEIYKQKKLDVPFHEWKMAIRCTEIKELNITGEKFFIMHMGEKFSNIVDYLGPDGPEAANNAQRRKDNTKNRCKPILFGTRFSGLDRNVANR